MINSDTLKKIIDNVDEIEAYHRYLLKCKRRKTPTPFYLLNKNKNILDKMSILLSEMHLLINELAEVDTELKKLNHD